jgi:hypothetical protein
MLYREHYCELWFIAPILFSFCTLRHLQSFSQYSLSRRLALAVAQQKATILFSTPAVLKLLFFVNFKLLLFVFVLTWGFPPQPHSGAGSGEKWRISIPEHRPAALHPHHRGAASLVFNRYPINQNESEKTHCGSPIRSSTNAPCLIQFWFPFGRDVEMEHFS